MATTPRLDLRQRQTQRLGLSAQVLTGLAVLKMSGIELAEALSREAEENPFLLPGLPPPRTAGAGAMRAADDDATARIAARPPDWQMALLEQIGLLALPPDIAALARALVAELDARGRLDSDLGSLAARWKVRPETLEAALAALQGCEPAGVGARGLTECLALQLTAFGMAPADALATLAEMTRFGRRDWDGAARALGITRQEATQRAALLRRLSPDPVGHLRDEAAPTLRPDLILVRAADGTPGVQLARDDLPQPALDAALVSRAAAQGFGTALLARAQAMIRAVEGRHATLLRIGTWLVRRQAAALSEGAGALRPALRRDCAAALGLHPATVGRAVAGKALLADGRLWPLSRLFTRAAPGAMGQMPVIGNSEALYHDAGVAADESPAAAAIAHRIARLIAQENPKQPLSDDRLQRILANEGVDMARRTVTKYRNGLRIPAAHLRRQRG